MHVLISSNKEQTFMMTSHDVKTLVIFENPVKEVDSKGNNVVYFRTINIRRM